MSQLSVGKLLPNLTVTLGNDPVDTDSKEDTDILMDSQVEVVRPNIDNLISPKVYMNRNGGFTTGIDLLEQENSGILTKRAERFGLEVSKFTPSLSSLYESLGIDIKHKDSGKMKHVRLNAIHVRGVEELDSTDIFTYFQDYGPSHIEWINDSSCNVIWFDDISPARALLGLSKVLPDSFNLKLIKPVKRSSEPVKSSVEPKDNTEEDEMEVDSSASEHELNIPVPPGHWRIGVPYLKTKALLLRFATKVDKKVPGAEKRSKFYKKYGNPNYGGLKGLISSSRKHKTQAAANRQVVERESSYKRSFSSTSIPKTSKTKTIKMRMYADEEELKSEKIRSKGNFTQKRSNVRSRLGSKYTSDDLCRLGSYRDFDNTQDQAREYNFKPKSSSWDLRSKLKKQKSDYKRESSAGQSSRSYNRDSYAGSSRRSYDKDPYAGPSSRNYDRESYAGPSSRSYDREFYAGQSSRSDDRENTFGGIKEDKRVENLKKDKKSIYKRKYRSPLCADEDDDIEETSSSE